MVPPRPHLYAPFQPPRTEPPPAPQTCTNGAQHSEPPDEDLDPEVDKELFHFEEDIGGIIKRTILKMLGRAWKDTRNHLYNYFYKSDLTLEQNIKGRPSGITADHWRWFLDYRNSEETKKCRKNVEYRSKQLYTHTGGSKSLARLSEEEERIAKIEQHDESSRLLSQNDSLAQALGKEHPGRVRGIGIGPTTSQVFGTISLQPSIETQREETQRVLLELQLELAVEKLKWKAMKDEAAAEKMKRQAMESALMCLVQGQGGELPLDVATWMNSLEGQSRE
ncbi:hypothetical protein Ahy_B10g102434 [Arachis hypogaea]|uniref:Uncharacterized protein n=1 Tax=Arachis hypogaea TaxID=3818 RepID=A0A444X1T8_ARAHY|nr:hypothetical protein Ahy_B10g102434 [Arachis hypogaea]